MFPFWTKISVYKWLNIKRRTCRSPSRDLNSYCVSSDHLEIWPELTMDYPLDNTFDKFYDYDYDNRTWSSHGLYLDNSSDLMQRSWISWCT